MLGPLGICHFSSFLNPGNYILPKRQRMHLELQYNIISATQNMVPSCNLDLNLEFISGTFQYIVCNQCTVNHYKMLTH